MGDEQVESDRGRCLEEFETYYRTHYEVLTQYAHSEPGERGGRGTESVFDATALLRLYDDYCRDSVARLYDGIQKVIPWIDRESGGGGAANPRSILDITCFATTQLFRIRFPDASVHACDKHLKWQTFLEGVECRICDLEKDRLPYDDESFDLAVFTETLEHIPRSPYVILNEVKRVLRKGGVLLFSVPNLSSFTNRIKFLLGRNVLSVELAYADSFGHFREYNMREVTDLFREVGMQTLRTEYVYYAPPQARGTGVRAVRTLASGLVTRSLSALVPSFRPVCMAIVRK